MSVDASCAALPRRFGLENRLFPRYAPPRRSWPRRILVGTDGTSSAVPAIEAARAIADRSGTPVEMETVYRPRVPLPASGTHRGIDECERYERAPALTLLQRVRRQRRELAQHAHGGPLRFEIGDPAAVIARTATESRCDLVVTGIGHFDPVAGRCTGRTVLRIARHLGAALLAAAPGCEAPGSAVLAFPDGRVHEPTIRAALQLLPPDAPVWIALPDQSSTAHPELIEARDPRFERVDISGDMLSGVLRLVRDTGAQLVATPNRGAPGQVRVFLPNIAEPLLVAAPCSVLVVPDGVAAR